MQWQCTKEIGDQEDVTDKKAQEEGRNCHWTDKRKETEGSGGAHEGVAERSPHRGIGDGTVGTSRGPSLTLEV